MNAQPKLDHVELRAAPGPRHDEILTPDALAFLAELHRRFNVRRLAAFARRTERQKLFDELYKRQLVDTPLIILFNGIEASAQGKRIQGAPYWEGKQRL